MARGYELIEQLLLKPVLVPALNKWTKVAPCVRHISVMQNFCQLIPRAFEAAFHTASMIAEANNDSSEDEGAQVGMPLNEQKVWRKLARLRLGKAGLFLKDDSSRWATAVWTVLTAPVMTIHYSLFKHATWLSDRHTVDPAQQDAVPLNPEDDSLTAVCFCQAAANPAKKALTSLSDLFFNVDHEDWGPEFGLWPGFVVASGQVANCKT